MKSKFFIGFLFALFLGSCKKDVQIVNQAANNYDPTPYNLVIPSGSGWKTFPIPQDNPLTQAGVDLGKRLFFEPMLSANNSQSCASCHNPLNSFSDGGKAFSLGAFGQVGKRNAPALFNLGWMDLYNSSSHHFFWDGGANDLERQVIGPITNPIEMGSTLPQVVQKLQKSTEYPGLFKKAFGSDSITSVAIAKAVAQYERTLISANSPYDKAERRERLRTPSEYNGFLVFLDQAKGDCFHCHGSQGSPYFTDFQFNNNGLDEYPADSGLARITGNPDDIGKFKTPSLRNLAFTAPYMHDGRFKTLMEVIEFYNSGTKNSATVSPFISKHFPDRGLNLRPDEKIDLLNFLISLSDTDYVNKANFK